MKKSEIKAIAIHLPQFHPIAENDGWWGKGFTEWTNVTKARPLFKNHNQPQLPADLGFYDLRLPETMEAQAVLAKQYGIYGFCYYHYWFNGKRILNRPVDDMLKSSKSDFPFMLFWANETWSRRWLGEEKEVLIKQTYSDEDDLKHAQWLCENAFFDSRYITISGRPAFVIYRPNDLPDYKKTIAIIKATAIKYGLKEPYFIASNSHTQALEGFDKILNFEPQLGLLPDAFNDKPSIKRWIRNVRTGINSSTLKVYDYKKVKELMQSRKFNYSFFPCVFVNWDNTPRRGKKGIIFHNFHINPFKDSIRFAKNLIKDNKADEKIIFINAWNEWAEGNHLEPDNRYGHEYLKAVKEVLDEN